ncbi:MAG: sugar porter family MFS transporter [Massilibacteroides sp.]|nr:sugar porter family MFS transporter [Massilibacteroides sp.]MDD3062908.1 sugar porter family MFS transporter [Massilibacteroides sp.]MDD4115002.1 sugar porter family MFS transporter [Massilibacteroides sp.]MDD4660455.1 sugar porter family MFS transporter [Massilibacteroides sp.]
MGKENMGYIAFLSFVAALGGLLFGYDTAVISGTVSAVTEQFQLSAMQSGWYVGCALVGSIIGVLFAGTLSDNWGRKWTMFISAVVFLASAVGCMLSNSLNELVVWRIVGGAGIGIVSVACPLYISEVSPASHRGRLVSLYQLAITIGFLASYLVNFFLSNLSVDYASSNGMMQKIFGTEIWRGMLGAETFPALLFFIVIFLIPESPRWLLVKQRDEKAFGIFSRIFVKKEDALAQIKEIKEMLNVSSGEVSDWRVLIQKGFRKAVLVGCAIAILGQFMGVNAVLYYGPSIFESSGLSSGDSLFFQSWIGVVNMLTTMLALFIVDKVGRKKLVYVGVSGMIITLVMIGLYFIYSTSWGLSGIFLLVCFLAYIFFTAGSISAVIFIFLSEMYPAKVRGKAMSVATLSLWIGTYLIGQLTPWMLVTLTPSGTFFLFAAICIPYMLVVWKLMPETAGKSLEEIERFWLKER